MPARYARNHVSQKGLALPGLSRLDYERMNDNVPKPLRRFLADSNWFKLGNSWFETDGAGNIICRKTRWDGDEGFRRMAIRFVVADVLKTKPAVVGIKQLEYEGLGSTLQKYYSNQPYRMMKSVFPELNLEPSDMARVPNGFGTGRTAQYKTLLRQKAA